MTFHLEEKRYSAVIGSAGEIFLRGVLDESSDLKQTADLIRERHKANPNAPIELDFTDLVSASWNGFLSLDKLLAELNFSIVLRHVSFDMFRYVALLPTLRKAQLGEIELAVVSGANKVQLKSPEALAVSASGRFVTVGGQQIVGRHSFIFGDKLAAPTSATMKTEFDVWYDYIAFATITLALSEDLAKSIAMSVIRLSNELAAEYNAQARVMQLLKNTDKSTWAREAEDEAKTLADRARSSDSIYGQIMLGIKKNVQLAEDIQKAMHSMEGQEREPILAAVGKLRTVRLQLLEIVLQIENGGTETFALLISIPGKQLFDDAYAAVSMPSTDTIAAIREAFSVMDPLTEDDWDATLEDIYERNKYVEQLVSNLIVLTQGFDLLRQIIEHRIAEIASIEAYLDQGAPVDGFEVFKRQLHDRIKNKMVTDQEKLSVDAFIPDALEEQNEVSHKPGEVLLF